MRLLFATIYLISDSTQKKSLIYENYFFAEKQKERLQSEISSQGKIVFDGFVMLLFFNPQTYYPYLNIHCPQSLLKLSLLAQLVIYKQSFSEQSYQVLGWQRLWKKSLEVTGIERRTFRPTANSSNHYTTTSKALQKSIA